ncbi:hypothetical protein ACVXG7_27815 [Enterobacter hormaechei]
MKASADFKPNTRFTQIALAEPEKAKSGTLCLTARRWMRPARPNIIMLDGKHIIESRVDLKEKKILRWEPIKDAHGMVLLDDSIPCSRSSMIARSLPPC